MRRLLLLLLLVAVPAAAQTIPPRGSDATFDVAAWNVLRFGWPTAGPPDTQQRLNVGAVIRQAEIDLWAMQEINDPVDWQVLLTELAPDGYVGVLGPSVSSSPEFDLRLAFIYDPTVVSLVQTRTILAGSANDFGGRPPFEMIANVTSNGVTQQIRFINIHGKAGTTLADYNRRLGASQALKTFTDAYRAQGIAFMVLGDFNDRLTLSITSGQLSPYRNFAQATADYEFATRTMDQANTPTHCTNSSCTSGTTRDHFLFPSSLFGPYVEGSGGRYAELVSAIPNYTSSTSDHLPVLARFDLSTTSSADGPAVAGVATLLPPRPSPFADGTTLSVSLAAPAVVRLDVLDVLGRVVATVLDGPLAAGTHTARLDGAALAPGVYAVRLTADGRSVTRTLVRTR